MDLPEANTHSFIIKIWVEEGADEAGNATWRGHITHVPSGARRYLKDLDVIVDVIQTYLEAMGVRLGYWVRAKRWLRARKFFRRRGKRIDLRNDGPE